MDPSVSPTPDVPTPPRVKEALRASFPGVPIEETARVGGVVWTVYVWHFRVTVSLTTALLVPADPPGRIQTVFEFAYPGRDVVMLSTLSSSNMPSCQLDLGAIRSNIAGIAAALTMALDPPPDPPKTQFFGA